MRSLKKFSGNMWSRKSIREISIWNKACTLDWLMLGKKFKDEKIRVVLNRLGWKNAQL